VLAIPTKPFDRPEIMFLTQASDTVDPTLPVPSTWRKRGPLQLAADLVEASGRSSSTVNRATQEVRGGVEVSDRRRRPGGGDKPAIDKQPVLLGALDELVWPETRASGVAVAVDVDLDVHVGGPARRPGGSRRRRSWCAGRSMTWDTRCRHRRSSWRGRRTRTGPQRPVRVHRRGGPLGVGGG
jgi:hypothetical protein